MIIVERTQNPYIIRDIFKEDWDLVTDDGCGAFNDFYPDVNNPKKYFLLVKEDNSLICLVMIYEITHTLADSHLIVCKNSRGKNLTEHFDKVYEFLKKNTAIKTLVTMFPTTRAYMYRYTAKYGWKKKCTLKNAYQKNGKLGNMALLELEI